MHGADPSPGLRLPHVRRTSAARSSRRRCTASTQRPGSLARAEPPRCRRPSRWNDTSRARSVGGGRPHGAVRYVCGAGAAQAWRYSHRAARRHAWARTAHAYTRRITLVAGAAALRECCVAGAGGERACSAAAALEDRAVLCGRSSRLLAACCPRHRRDAGAGGLGVARRRADGRFRGRKQLDCSKQRVRARASAATALLR